MKNLPIGISDYKKIIQEDCYYVDKTLLVHELLAIKDSVTLICRPRRFGKTINLSMLKYFFEKTPDSHAYLFTDKKIWQNKDARLQQGQYPIIFITFKDVKKSTFEDAYEAITELITEEFKRHEAALAHSMDDYEIKKYQAILNKTASLVEYSNSLLFLTKLLHKSHGKQTIVLIDEYDTPIHTAYLEGYYKEMVRFIKSLFSAALKDNSHLERGVLTGILRTAKEGIFSDLNNLTVCTLLSKDYSDKFGFTPDEVDQLLIDQNLVEHRDDIRRWYNGYHAAESTLLYNPWSVLMCAREHGALKPHWANTSDNKLIATLLARSSNDVKIELEDILNNKPIIKVISESFTLATAEYDNNILWSLLLFSGYITYRQRTLNEEGAYECSLALPNHELHVLYKTLIRSIITQIFPVGSKIQALFSALGTGNTDTFSELLQEFILASMSFYDFSNKEPEKSYHLFVLGLLVMASDQYTVKSNRESGYGRYDIILIPHNKNHYGVVIEFKTALRQTLEAAADTALAQIKEKNYINELHALSIQNVIGYGIAFQGKEILVKSALL